MFSFVIPWVFGSLLVQLPLNCAAGRTVAVALVLAVVVALVLALAWAVAVLYVLAVAVALAAELAELFENALAISRPPPRSKSRTKTAINTIIQVGSARGSG